MSSTYLPNSSTLLPSYISQSPSNIITSSPQFAPDGGVYQGHSLTQPNNWNPNTKVHLLILEIYFLKKKRIFF
jgi:hypothetical protein